MRKQYIRIVEFIIQWGSITQAAANKFISVSKLATRIGEMERKYGLVFHREFETGKNQFGEDVRFMRYYLSQGEIAKWRKLIAITG